MNTKDFIPHIDALRDVVDIHVYENQNIITFGSDNYRSVVVDLKHKRISSLLFNIISNDYCFDEYRGPLVYMMTLNGREPSPKEFCLKFRRKGRIKEIHLADLTKGKNSTPKGNLKHISALWNLIEENFQLDDEYDTEYQMSARNAIFG